MSTYLIAYNPKTPGQNYDRLGEAIQQAYKASCRCLDSTWVVISEKNAVEVRDSLMRHVDAQDLLLVCEVTKNMSWTALPPEVHDWLVKLF